MRGAGNPRIGGFPRSWVAPAVQPPSSLSLSLNFARRLYLCAGKEKRRSLYFGNWPNPAMFSICCKGKAARCRPKTALLRGPFFAGKTAAGKFISSFDNRDRELLFYFFPLRPDKRNERIGRREGKVAILPKELPRNE